MQAANDNIAAQALMHHAYLLGLQLMIASNQDAAVVGDWMFRLFRRQHQEKFLSSFEKLGLDHLPDAVACAQYHVMSNSIGGVPVEYMWESDRKAWVRFRYPRWMYHGATICGVPVEVSRGFLRGWYAQNGVSLNNPRLGFVCVSEDMTGEFGFCGYFREFDFELTQEQRLQFARDELPPAYLEGQQPQLPAEHWSHERLEKANRNYAIDFIRNSIIELAAVIGEEQTEELAGRAARLIGLQYFQETRAMVGTRDGDLMDAARYLEAMFQGMGDETELEVLTGNQRICIQQKGLRIVRGVESGPRDLVLACWQQLWTGALRSYRSMKQVDVVIAEEKISWTLSEIQSQVR